MRVLVLLLVAVAITASYANSFLKNEEYATVEERKQFMDEAIEEAKAAMAAKELAKKNRVITENEKNGKYTSSQLLSKFFKRPSEDTRKMGKAHLLYKDIVHRAERKIFELKRAKVAKSQGTEAKAESLAEMLFHRPGSMLTSQEIGRAWEEADGIFFRFPRKPPNCNFATVDIFRTIDGTCNNFLKPLMGASGTVFKRLVPPVYEDGISSLRGTLQAQNKLSSISSLYSSLDAGNKLSSIGPFLPPNPSPRFISETVILNVTQDEIPFTHLLMQWGQFLDHDLDLTPEFEQECEGCEFTETCQPIKVPNLDRSFGVGTNNNGSCLPFSRSIPMFTMDKPLSFTPEEQVNDLTAFIDASMVYGSRLKQSQAIRGMTGGLLSTGKGFSSSLPIDIGELVQCPNRMDCFLCGDIRCNEHFSLTIMHTLWLREHNRCARQLTRINPHWDNEKLYQNCRKIVGALIQKITYEDYLPKLIGDTFDRFIGRYVGYNSNVDPSIPNSFATAAYRYGHSLIRTTFERLGPDYVPLLIGPLKLIDAFFSPDQFRTSLGTDPIMRGWVNVNSRRMDEFMNSVLTTQLFQTTPSGPGMDLGSLNLQRGRDHGLSPYYIYRNFCFKKFGITSYFENDLTLVRFLKLHGSLDTAELWISGMAEERLRNGLLGATFSCIFGLTFQAVRDGDRFFWRNPGVFTPQQVASINKDSIARVICDNSDAIRMIQPDAFLSNQSRIPCTRLGRVNLNLFRDTPCYLRVQMRPRNFIGEISIFSRSTQINFDYTNLKIPASPTTVFKCVPFQCPTRTIPTDTVIFSSGRQFPNTIIRHNPSFPDFGDSPFGVYRAFFPFPLFDRGNGLFMTKSACVTSNAFTFQINQFLPAKSATQTSDTDTSSDRLSSEEEISNMYLPKIIMDMIRSENPNAVFESVEKVDSILLDRGEEVKEQEEPDSLFRELEEALKKFN